MSCPVSVAGYPHSAGVESISRASRGDRRSLLRPSSLAKRRERERIKQNNIEDIVRVSEHAALMQLYTAQSIAWYHCLHSL